jgi:urease accessory protein
VTRDGASSGWSGRRPGDDLALSLRLRPGARATLRAVAASLAQGGASSLSMRADLAEGADLVADPGALIVCAGSRVDVRLELALGAGAVVDWRELVVLGRTGEPPGRATLRWDVTRCGRPVLRQAADVSLAGHRVLASALISDPAGSARTVACSATAVAQRADQHTPAGQRAR